MPVSIPKIQKVALVRELGGNITFVDDYPVPEPRRNEVLAKVLYTGVCQSDLHTARGIASGADGKPITKIKLPHIGGHEGIGRILRLGDDVSSDDIKIGSFVGIRFGSRICRRCEFCLAGTEQYCVNAKNHLHHEDGSFQQYVVLDADYLTLLPSDIEPQLMGPVLCAGLTAYKAVRNTGIRPGNWLAVIGAGGGLGHFAVQYARIHGARVIAVDGPGKEDYVHSLGAERFVDYTASKDVSADIITISGGGAHAVVVTAGEAKAFSSAADCLRIGGTLSCVGIPPEKAFIETPVSTIVIKGLKIMGNLVGSHKECLEAVELVRLGAVKPDVRIRPFKDLPQVYEELEMGDLTGRTVLQICEE